MITHDCSECRRIEAEIDSFQDQANILRRGKSQNEEPLPDNPADWLVGFESDEAITDQLREIGQGVTHLRDELAQHTAQNHAAG
jgi:hypothetical protein